VAVTRKSKGQSRGINARAWFYGQSFHTFSDVDLTPARLAAPEAGSGPGFPTLSPVVEAAATLGTVRADREAAAHPTEYLPVNAASFFLNEFDFGLGITSISALVDEVMADTCLMCESTENVSKCKTPGCTEHFCPACMIEHNNAE
jgi:hypothetical protein